MISWKAFSGTLLTQGIKVETMPLAEGIKKGLEFGRRNRG
jgi:hypothetical protein